MVGFDTSDDASVYKINETTALIQTVDIFPPVADDPYDFGRIAAANALSDVYAMGGEPKLALNILCYPEDFPIEYVEGILLGGYEKVAEAGAIITGGHTIKDPVPKYGLSASGFAHPKDIRTNNGVKEGDVFILTKPIGIGVLNSATTAGIIPKDLERLVIDTMAELNKRAFEISRDFDIHACTDITGFGLLGHACEMFQDNNLTFDLDSSSVPILKGAMDYAIQEVIPGGAYNNKEYVKDNIHYDSHVSQAMQMLLSDPQTSGGLLFALSEKDAKELLKRLQESLSQVGIIGVATSRKERMVHVR